MTQEERQLLIRDLACRLPYNVVVGCTEDDEPDTFFKCILTGEMLQTIIYKTEYFNYTPFLRPMSSMTEEEKNVFHKLVMRFNEYELFYYNLQNRNVYEYLFTYTSELLDWLNANHFDYRGLIERGLAIEVTEKNNPY